MRSGIDQNRTKRTISPEVLVNNKRNRSKLPQRKRLKLSPVPVPCCSISEVSVVSNFFDGENSVRNEVNDVKEKSKTTQSVEVLVVSESDSSCSDNGLPVNDSRAEAKEAAESIVQSELSCFYQQSPAKSYELSSKLCQRVGDNYDGKRNQLEFNENDVISVKSGAGASSELLRDSAIEQNVNGESECSKISKYHVESSFAASNVETTTTDQKLKSLKYECELACNEEFAINDVVSEYSSSQDPFLELQSEHFGDSFDVDFSDCSSTFSFDSGIEENQTGDSTPSPTFSLLLQYREQFCKSKFSLNNPNSSNLVKKADEVRCHVAYNEDAESFQMLRSRERRQVYLRNYGDEYGTATIQQRSQMVNWMIERSTLKELQKETLFLGVNLFDRFLSEGSFESQRNLRIAGIACLTLATRIEENQPYNSVRQKKFCLGGVAISRCEVVAMEWLVQEVLNFQCTLPTVFNFLWLYLKAVRANQTEEMRAKALAEYALLDHELLCFWPSTVASALVILACMRDSSCQHVIQTSFSIEDDDLPRCMESLQWAVKHIC